MRFLNTQRCQLNWRGRLLRLEPLEDRRLLTIFAPTDGDQLAADLVIAESSGGSNTINLGALTYTLPSARTSPVTVARWTSLVRGRPRRSFKVTVPHAFSNSSIRTSPSRG